MKICALVSAYFAEKYIDRKIISLATQTYPAEPVFICQKGSYEHKAVDAASRKFYWKYPPVIIATPDIPKLYTAWNLGIQNSSSEFLTNSNTDDILYKNAFELLINGIGSFDFCYGFNSIMFEKSGKIVNTTKPKQKRVSYRCLLKNCFLGPFPLWRRDLHDRFGLYDERFKSAGDYEFYLRCMKAGATVTCVHEFTGIFVKKLKKTNISSSEIASREVEYLRSIYN